jgi:hypothetical protein
LILSCFSTFFKTILLIFDPITPKTPLVIATIPSGNDAIAPIPVANDAAAAVDALTASILAPVFTY